MLRIARSTLRVRWSSFVGSFVALALGVALMATAALVIAATGALETAQYRYAAAPAVIVPDARFGFTDGDGQPQREPVARQPGLSPALVAAVARTGRVTADRSFAAQVLGGPRGQVGHGWSAAAFGGYRLTAGRAPAADGEVVLGSGDPGLVGRSVRLLTDAGPLDATVTGVTAAVPFEHAVFLTDAQAERLSPAVNALVAYGAPDDVRRAAEGSDVKVLTGVDRESADPGRIAALGQLESVSTPLGLAAGVAAFVSVFVVAGTFALSIAQRRRELAMLRLVGASRGQLRNLVLTEALLVGLAASAVGCALGLVAAPAVGRWLVDRGLAPAGFVVAPSGWALLVAALVGLLTAVGGVLVCSVRAAMVGPMDALREAAAPSGSRVATVLRWSLGGAGLLGGVAVMAAIAGYAPEYAGNAGGSAALALWTGGVFVILAGVLAGPAIRLLSGPAAWVLARRRPGMVWQTARRGALGARQRTAATVTPAVIVVALTGCLLGSVDTIGAARVAAARHQLAATDFVVTPAGTTGLNRAAVDRIRAVPGTTVLTETPSTLVAVQDRAVALGLTVMAADPAQLRAVGRLPLISGSLDDLGPDSAVLSQEWPGSPKTGQSVQVRLADGTPRTLRVAAVLASAEDTVQGYVSSALLDGSAPASVAYVQLAPGADRSAVSTALATAVDGFGARVDTPAHVAAGTQDANEQQAAAGLLLILGCSLLYAAIALANTLAMTTADRRRELLLLRLAGASRSQVLRMVATEALLCVAGGVLLGAIASALSAAGAWAALRRLVGPLPVAVPWTVIGTLGGVCALVALAAALIPAALILRPRTLAMQ
ncbi:ABC transporter permease [Kitasatospora aureofaciens]|uniref:ABC transporter permease n=1 Tax=Kitasatospora aureofaciens TaxID=1894 RepID=UPI001C47EEBC|nr:ABC transporter permease [Kitasatospora aureofaciens]MBV6699822.1 ABC transporter permease [Kitasatospora aureofaciens]